MPTAEEEGYEDETRTCDNASCGREFVWKAGEQRFYAQVGNSPPELCKKCRIQRDEQQPETLTCKACGEDYTYTAQYIINWRRNEGKWKRDICKPCFKDPQRAERLKAWKKAKKARKKLKDEKEKLPFEDTVGYYLLRDAPDEYEGIVNRANYSVYTNVHEYDVPEDADWYANIPDRVGKKGMLSPRTVLGHIMEGGQGKGHGWEAKLGTDEPQVVVSLAAPIARCTDMDVVLECTEGRFTIKYDITIGVVVFIVDNEDNPPPYRLNSSYSPSQESVAKKIIGGQWDIS